MSHAFAAVTMGKHLSLMGGCACVSAWDASQHGPAHAGPPSAVNTHLYALHDTAMTAISHIAAVFGSELVPLVRDASVSKSETVPHAYYGQPAELLALLHSCLPA